ncbi:hypothetical protein P691DRAFT_566228 [Macrolepiota fuliginosa MF-IS2]|uniref:Uncharacterized protein n=1 Tax=Macrolepiota fuliginosa MF-IS2 TaxID=1400762 RepID=A0A9P6C5Q2_9AGAR|nr:hypothetical protein P691DRAFT_566228 [Macrolepiota fuliginosa MF-IS2]
MGISKEIDRFGACMTCSSIWSVRVLVTKLAKACPQYRNLVTQVLVDDPMILEKTIHIQFKKLIVDPWEVIRVSHPHYLSRPLLIMVNIFNGGDPEVNDEFIGLIRDYSQARQNSPLLWLICSYSEPSLWRRLVQAAYPNWCELWRVSLTDAEAQKDTRYLLDEGFRKIRNRHNIDDTEPWPSEEQASMLTKAMSGIPYFVDAVLKFIDCGRGKPQDQVKLCLKYVDGIPDSSVSAPFRTVDYFYNQFISNLPLDIQPDALRILETLDNARLCHNMDLRIVAHLLGMGQSRLYYVLDGFHSVLQIPPPESPNLEIIPQTAELGTFVGFLERRYSGSSIFFQSLSRILASYPTRSSALKAMRWTPSKPINHFHTVGRLMETAQSLSWIYRPTSSSSPGDPVVYDHIRDFDFRRIASGFRTDALCHTFLQWLFVSVLSPRRIGLG